MITGSNVVLYVPGTIKLSGSSSIVLAAGASAKIYVAGSADLSGGGLINAGNANNLQVYGLPTCTSINYSGSSSFTGTIYAPEADFSLSGGASFYGAVVSKSYTSSGGSNFHYDESLGTGGPLGPFVATTWQEVAYP
jgi:choice-of-anchor A domain-containing protein